MDAQKRLHVAMLASPGMGHLIPSLLLGTRLVTHHHLRVTVLAVTVPNSPAPPSPTLTDLKIIQIPAPDVSGLANAVTNGATMLCIIMREARPGIRSAISSLNPPPDFLIADLFGSESWPIADEFRLPKYVYIPSNARFVALSMCVPVFDKEVKGQYVDLKEPLIIPGCRPVQPEDIIDPMQNRDDQIYREYVRMGTDYKLSDGILMNTWEDLERGTINAMRNDEILRSLVKVPVYPIGPLSRPVEPASSDDIIIEWLDKQPAESVLFMSFGSAGTLSAEQVTEIAWGLELSQQRFVWVFRPPTGKAANATYFEGSGSGGAQDYLPEGFLDRTHKVGLIVEKWAPQVKILEHPSIGGFLSHCGWNSALESIGSGVPIIVWPLYAEQTLNAALLTEELSVAVRPEVQPARKMVAKDEIENMVRTLMESDQGKSMRDRMKELKRSGEEALSIEGGSSYNSMCQFIKDCRLKLENCNT